MLWLNDYKKFRAIAEQKIKDGSSSNVDINIWILKYRLNKVTYLEAVNNIINILSNGEHFKPYSR